MKISKLQKSIGYQFINEELLKTALVHSSAVKQYKRMSNQRLEFLGDAVLQLVISSYLYMKLDGENEGALSKCRSLIVCTDSLYKSALKIGLNDYLLLGKGEENNGGRTKRSIIADAFESLIGAIYIDGGLNAAEEFIMDKRDDIIKTAVDGSLRYDYKTLLQEYAQSHEMGDLTYELKRVDGPEHDQVFYSCVKINGCEYPVASGKNRKHSEQNAAKLALEHMKVIGLHRRNK